MIPETRTPQVPESWPIAPFPEVVTVVSDKGKRVKQRSYLTMGKIPVIDQGQEYIGGYTDDENMAFDGELPVILFGIIRGQLSMLTNALPWVPKVSRFSNQRNGFQPKFFYYLLHSLEIPSRGYSRHFQFLKKFNLPVAPLEQQKRIVGEVEKQLSRLDEAVASLKRAKSNLRRYKAAVLKAALKVNSPNSGARNTLMWNPPKNSWNASSPNAARNGNRPNSQSEDQRQNGDI